MSGVEVDSHAEGAKVEKCWEVTVGRLCDLRGLRVRSIFKSGTSNVRFSNAISEQVGSPRRGDHCLTRTPRRGIPTNFFSLEIYLRNTLTCNSCGQHQILADLSVFNFVQLQYVPQTPGSLSGDGFSGVATAEDFWRIKEDDALCQPA
jgi:hypothetical protein